jgi:hypothetical protein
MAIAMDRPTVRERIAAEISDGCGLDQAAALGSAQMKRGDDGQVLTVNDAAHLEVKVRAGLVERDGRDLGLELAALLLRAKYAGDFRGITQARYRFALRLRVRTRAYLRRRGRASEVVHNLAGQTIAEWIADRCEPCKGTGIRGLTMGGVEEFLRPCSTCDSTGSITYIARGLRPNGSAAPKAAALRTSDDAYTQNLYAGLVDAGKDRVTMQCPSCRGMRYLLERKRVRQRFGKVCLRCDGEGDAKPRYTERARALSVSMESYHRSWHSWFDWAHSHLTALDKTLVANLRCELGTGYSPAP